MNMKRRVVVTGMGAVTPIGVGVDTFWDGIVKEKIGFAPISYFDTDGYMQCLYFCRWGTTDCRKIVRSG